MVDLKAFRASNDLFQKDLSQYLGVTIGFISAIERGERRLPAEQLTKLLENPNGWDTRYLTMEDKGTNIHNDYRQMTVTHNSEGCEYSGTVNNYNGVSDEDVEKIVAERLAAAQAKIDSLEAEKLKLQNDIDFLKSTCERYLKIIENFSSADGETNATEKK